MRSSHPAGSTQSVFVDGKSREADQPVWRGLAPVARAYQPVVGGIHERRQASWCATGKRVERGTIWLVFSKGRAEPSQRVLSPYSADRRN